MKLKLTFLLGFCSATLMAQVLNSGFENWSGGEPVDWQTSNSAQSTNVTQVSNAHSGSSAIRMDTWTAANFWFGAVIACPETGGFFAVSQATAPPTALTGWYISNFVSGDHLVVTTTLQQGGTTVAGGTLNITNNTSVYQMFSIPLTYNPSNAVPDSGAIGILQNDVNNSSSALHQGTYVILDDIQLTGTNDVGETQPVNGIEKICPNPAGDVTWVEYSVTEPGPVGISVYDVNGNLVQTLVQQEQQPGRYRVAIETAQLAGGLYLVRMQAGENLSTMKLSVNR